jgi:hypothetical protein
MRVSYAIAYDRAFFRRWKFHSEPRPCQNGLRNAMSFL